MLRRYVRCSVEEQAKGWVSATVVPRSGSPYMPQQRDLQTGSILILSSQKPPGRQVQNWLQRGLTAASSPAQAGTESGIAHKHAPRQEPAAAHVSHSRSPSPLPGKCHTRVSPPNALHVVACRHQGMQDSLMDRRADSYADMLIVRRLAMQRKMRRMARYQIFWSQMLSKTVDLQCQSYRQLQLCRAACRTGAGTVALLFVPYSMHS